MYYPNVEDYANSREMISFFLGYNHNPVIEDGEMYDMKNLSSDHYPLLAPRKKRNVKMQLKNTRWDNRPATFTKNVVGDLTYQDAIYTGAIIVDGVKNIRVSYTADMDILELTTVKITCKDSNNVVIGELEEEFDKAAVSHTYLTLEETASIEIKITGHTEDVEHFDPLEDYITLIKIEEHNNTVRGVLCKDGKLAYMIGQHLYYDNIAYDLEDYLAGDDRISKVKLLSFGAYILIFPQGIYFNTQDTTDIGYMGCLAEITGEVTYTLCNLSGEAYAAIAGDEPPADPEEGDYWLKTGGETTGLYVWSDSLKMWSGVATTYIKITLPDDITASFSEGDAVYMNTKYEDINDGSIIRMLGTDDDGSFIVVTGIMDATTDDETFTSSNPMTIDRRMPELDYVCVSQNRVWGCHYGQSEDGVLNEIYASKLGDFKNWFVYDGTAADSYALSLGDDGEFTGAVSYQGYPLFFKENCIYRIYGSYPENYQLFTYNCRGAQKGSEKSIAIVGQYLTYKSLADICVFDGSTPVSISDALGDIKYHDAVGGAGLNKYYVSMLNDNDEPGFFVYDFKHGVWHKEDDLRIEEFTYNQSGKLYGQSEQAIYGFEMATEDFELTGEAGEKDVEWMAITGDLALSSPDHKYPGRVSIKAFIPFGGEIKFSISNDEGAWCDPQILTGTGKVKTYSFVPSVIRSDSYRYKLEGHKDVKIYSITRTYSEGSETE